MNLPNDLLVETGSRLYGCETPNSDTDLRGFVIPSADALLGRRKPRIIESKDFDATIWEFPQFFHLLETGSPNVIELLFVPDAKILNISPKGKLLLENKSLFLSRDNVKPIQGFALSEWKKGMQYFANLQKIGERRLEEIKTIGYSIKNCYHAIRLLSQLHELLSTGTITFPRPEAELLRQIRSGAISPEELTEKWNQLDSTVPDAVAASVLPESQNRQALDDLYYQIIKDKIKEHFAC